MNDENTKLETLREVIFILKETSERHLNEQINKINVPADEQTRVALSLSKHYQTQINTFNTVLRLIAELERV